MPHDIGNIKDNGVTNPDYSRSDSVLSQFVQERDSKMDPLISTPITIEGKVNNISIDIAFQYISDDHEDIYSFVNNKKTLSAGSHIDGLLYGILREFTLDDHSKGWYNEVDIILDDVRKGLTAVVSATLSESQLKWQSNGALKHPEIAGFVSRMVRHVLRIFVEENPIQSQRIVDKIHETAGSREAVQRVREFIQRIEAISTEGVPPTQFISCSSSSSEESELFLVLGNSAVATAKRARDHHFQAILPLLKKLINVEIAVENKIYENRSIIYLFSVLGISFIEKDMDLMLNIEKLRYRKIIVLCDNDMDGIHWLTLLLTLFFRYLRPLVEEGYLYIAAPPLYQIRIANRNFYAWSEDEYRELVQHYADSDTPDAVTFHRFTSLGGMNADELWESTMDPSFRKLRQINIDDAAEADRIFSILMGEDILPRRAFIEKNAKYAKVFV